MVSSKQTQTELFASAISTPIGNLIKNIGLLEEFGVHGIHVDVMDGSFVPRIGMYPELVQELRSLTHLPIEVHMMIEDAERYVTDFVDAGADIIVPHIEVLRHPTRTIDFIRKQGAKAGIAINPGTNLGVLEDLVSQLDLITIMAINPGIVGHLFIEQTHAKLQKLKMMLGKQGTEICVEVDGGITFQNFKQTVHSGANRLVCGAGTIFHKERSLSENLEMLLRELENCDNV